MMSDKRMRTQTLLLVEDDSGLAALIASHFGSDQWSVSIAKNSKEALDFIKNAAEPYTFAILDIWLPTDEQATAQPYVGYQLAEQITTASSTTKIIGMSQFIGASSALRTSGRFFGFIEKPALIANPSETLTQCLRIGGPVVSDRSSLRQNKHEPRSHRHGLPWLLVAGMSGLTAAALPLAFVLLGSGIFRICLVVGLAVFLFVLLLNPRRRYFSAFTTILGIWASSTVIPALGLHIGLPKFLVSFFSQGPDPAFHIAAVVLMIVVLVLDWKTRLKP